MSSVVQEYRLSLNRLLWAPPVANAAALLATLQLLGNVEDPDYAFRALHYPIAILGIGAALGMVGILMGLMSLLSDLAVENIAALRDAWAQTDHPGRGWDEYIEKDLKRSQWREQAAVAAACLSIFCLLGAGAWAYTSALGGRLQPPAESRVPDRMLEGLKLLNDIIESQSQPASMPQGHPAERTVP